MRWAYNGQEPCKDYVHRMGSSARSLAVGDICFKNTLFQSIKPPCTLFIIDMEPSAEAYIFMDKRQYAEAINDRLEPPELEIFYFNSFSRELRNQLKYSTSISKISLIYLLGVTLHVNPASLRSM